MMFLWESLAAYSCPGFHFKGLRWEGGGSPFLCTRLLKYSAGGITWALCCLVFQSRRVGAQSANSLSIFLLFSFFFSSLKPPKDASSNGCCLASWGLY